MKKRILVADDNAQMRKMLCQIFSGHDHLELCDEASNGQEAVEMATRLRPDLVILDLAMPVMDGIKAAAAISKILPSVPIILFTLYAHEISAEDLADVGIKRVVPKNEAHTLVRHAEDLLRVA